VGDVATVFFRADGSWRDIPFNNRASGPDLDVLRGVSRRICVVAGAAKVPPLLGALAGGLISDLVVDEGTARAAIDQHDAQR
jgi:deoxyribonucleoside regulator